MAIIYRTAGAWGAGKGSDLTPAEVDGNFYDLQSQIDTLETGLDPVQIDTIDLTGNQLTITMDDATEFGPFTIPQATFTGRGTWAALTAYSVNDVVSVAGLGAYLVLVNHTSATSFDPDYLSGGDAAYQLIMAEPRATVAEVTGTTTTPTLGDAFAWQRCTDASGCAVTVPAAADVEYFTGTELIYVQQGAAAVTMAGDTGVTLNVPTGYIAETAFVGGRIMAKLVAADEWDVWGDLAASP